VDAQHQGGLYILIPIVSLLALAAGRRMRPAPMRRLTIVLGVLVVAYAVSLGFKHETGNPINLTYNLADYLFAFIPGVALAAIEPFAAPRLHGTATGRNMAWGVLGLCVG
jgi:peptidoglycan/LPS O-acetylase OafA/YrhL